MKIAIYNAQAVTVATVSKGVVAIGWLSHGWQRFQVQEVMYKIILITYFFLVTSKKGEYTMSTYTAHGLRLRFPTADAAQSVAVQSVSGKACRHRALSAREISTVPCTR